MIPKEPQVTWIKNDPEEHQIFEDGSKFLVALVVENQVTGKCSWELDVISIRCDEESFGLYYENGDPYDAWSWEDFEYFHVIEGTIPTPGAPC